MNIFSTLGRWLTRSARFIRNLYRESYDIAQNDDGTWRITDSGHTVESPFPSAQAAQNRLKTIKYLERQR